MMIARKKKKALPQAPIASMADIAFLLIIFFILTTTFMKEKNIHYKLPKEQNIKNIAKSPISVVIDKNGKTYLQGKECSKDALRAVLEGLLARRAEAAEKAKQKQKKKGKTKQDGANNANLVHFKCDRNVPRKVFEPIIIAISDAGGVLALVGEEANRDKRKSKSRARPITPKKTKKGSPENQPGNKKLNTHTIKSKEPS